MGGGDELRSILVVSHGSLAKGVCEAANMIYGELENVHYLCLEKDMGIETYKQNLEKLIEKISDSDEIIVLADLRGGSPFTKAVTLLSEKGLLSKSKVITGLNLPMLLSVLFINNDITEIEVGEIMNSAKEGISLFEVDTQENDEL